MKDIEMDDKIKIDDKIKDKLLPYQIQHTKNLVRVINKNNAVLDASDTGTGKTYTAIACCSILKLKPFIISPKSVLSIWRDVCKLFNVIPIGICNYEAIKFGKYYVQGRRKICPYLTIENKRYIWNMPKNTIFIFDEVHKCSGTGTHNARLLIGAKESNVPLMILSATVSDNPMKFRLFFYILNFIEPETVKKKNIDLKKYIRIMENWINRDQRPMVRIHNMLYPDRGSRMRIDVLGDMFPKNQISVTPYAVSHNRRNDIEREYTIIRDALDELADKTKKDKASIFVKVVRARQKIEMLKVPLFVELANDFMENGQSVVIFVNFTKTLETLSELLHTDCLIYGDQTAEIREANIQEFQNNESKIIICNIASGSSGISLHDIHGGHPRVSLISPTWNSIDLLQALGRIHRAGAKTPALQRIIFIDETIEERISEKLKDKLANINSINNGDLDLTGVRFENERRRF